MPSPCLTAALARPGVPPPLQGAMTYACGRQFSKYMERFYPVLQTGLAHHQVGAAGPGACAAHPVMALSPPRCCPVRGQAGCPRWS